MFRKVCNSISNNKNLLMLFTVGIYILSLYGTLSNSIILISLILLLIVIFVLVKSYFSPKILTVWCIVFLIGVLNTQARLRETDTLLNLSPVNSVIIGKIVSIPQIINNKQRFFFDVKEIEYDGMVKPVKGEKLLVSLETTDNLKIYDVYKIRGRLSVPFKAGNPSQFDYGNYLRNFNVYAVFYGHNPYSMRNLDVPCYEKISSPNSRIEIGLQKINDYREEILSVHSKYLESPYLEILGGIVFGDDAVSPPENIKQSFINSGLLHILAASGMNVAFIYSFFFFLLNLFRVNFRLNIILCITAVAAYVLMTGMGASVLRAALMLLFVLAGKLIDRDAHSIALLSFVAFIMLLYNPMYINDVGFQLSFVVTFGLLLMMPYIVSCKNKIINWCIATVCIPIIAQLWVIPIQIFYFNNISIYSVFANILSVPFLSVISFCGFISSLLSIIVPISDIVCQFFDFILGPLLKLIVAISNFWGSLPHASYQTTHPHVIQIILYYALLINISFIADKTLRENYGKVIKSSILFLVVSLLLTQVSVPNHNLEITAFDVGNADSFLIKTPNNKYLMIDTAKNGYNGGKSQAQIILLKYMIDNGIKNIDKIIVTHFDNDHSGGAVDLIRGIKVKEIYVNSLTHNSVTAKEIYKTAGQFGTNVIEAENNQLIFDNDNLKITNYIAKNTAGVGDNESSIITLLQYGDFSMLFTGDAGIETFNRLREFIPKNLTVLKVGHHGASGVINKEIAEYLNPRYSVISTGENKFGHPSVYTLKTLSKSEILRTDINNAIKFIVNDKGIKVFCFDNKQGKWSLRKTK